MRSLKFRAWVEEAKWDYYVYGIEERADMFEWFGQPTVHIEQYTGLKDKNGKEIYEGDIFRNTINDGTWRVSWDKKGAAFWVDSGVAGCSLGEFDYDRGEKEYGFISKNCEVIGNIHENGELLGGRMSSINDLPAFPPVSLTKSKAEELLAEIEKAKNPLATYLKNIGGEK